MADQKQVLSDNSDLIELGRKLLSEGPIKTLATPRRIRILFNNVYVADTTAALFVWEHQYYPYYYVPRDAFAQGVLKPQQPLPGSKDSKFWTAELSVGDASTNRVLGFEDGEGVLAGLVRVQFDAAQAWFEEDTPVYVHPKDPFRRVDVLHSARPLRVRVRGQLVAETTSSFHLYETGLPCRYYVPATAVDRGVLRDSGTTTACPYKGTANYYHAAIGDDLLSDLVWYYRTPTLECAAIAGCLCFYHEKEGVEVELDGKVLPLPKTPWS
ncbi:DUF427-domain-containing protein [Hypoxylon crocopeplum]|nr:DUF427-domain-containing protein [Hypoxylon crocopeplum]